MSSTDDKRREVLIEAVQEYGEPIWPENFMDEIPALTNIRPYLLVERTHGTHNEVLFSMFYSVKDALHAAAAEIYEGCNYPDVLIDLDNNVTHNLGISVEIMED